MPYIPFNKTHDTLMEDNDYSNTIRGDYWTNMTSEKELHLTLRDPTALEWFNVRYQSLHGYLSVGVCLFGIVSNVMNVVVLTRKNMITATNYILTALAIADMLTMLSYIPYAVYFYCVATLDERYPQPRGWIVHLLFNTNFNITCHTAAIWLTVIIMNLVVKSYIKSMLVITL